MSVNVDKILESPEVRHTVTYNTRDLLLYSVGIGESNLQFTYEYNENFAAFPLYPVCLLFKGQSQNVVPYPPEFLSASYDGLPSFNPAMILHGEQSIEILRPLDPSGGTLTGKTKIISFYDKGTGTLMETYTQFEDEVGPLVKLISGSFIRGLTGYKGKGRKLPPHVQIPKCQPDYVDEFKTSLHQAQIYRLSGDYNPLHVDPEVAMSVGFEKPILHGLCSMGIASRALFKQFCGGQVARFKSIRVRFSSPCYPGETIQTRMWQATGGRILFQAVVKERDVVILNGGEFIYDVESLSRL
ncbi:peroxisomal hydratase-dehydrogenase-epimerase [Plasmopara halstedii]|uniref:Peroxisomal hydratase-dehydrogenase-epimerase n=1 Tax=Plasmopara halstedii TaxID=4781 RepID=A0A0P1AZB8_PLAHL|nr:peroxisomal hydratase-dehydrogenase-epimerase [Plasmopara halstedii]CEG46784.1 peroxisomal hydratase-dehydrogenase-epimerase [Plasmopara halstedii]|eukprot:XP_024583153.1 peroxisomal hydratase-dehydrogenase-epimerase [Plasmopara halstedii]